MINILVAHQSLLQRLIWISAGVLVVLLLLRRFFRFRRINPLVDIAKKLEFSLMEDHDYALEHNLRDFFLLGHGRVAPRLFYVLSCRKGGSHMKIFDYNGTAYAFRILRFLFQTMCFVEADGRKFMDFIIVPKTLYWRLRSLFSQDIFIREGISEEFLRHYFLIVKKDQPMPKFQQDFFKSFLALGKPYSLETHGNRFIFYRHGVVVPVRRFGEFYKDFKLMSEALEHYEIQA